MPFTAEQLLERRNYLGGSEAAAAVGRCPFFTPLELFKSKKGELPPIEETIPMMVGTALEPVVIELLERQEGITVRDRQLVVYDQNNPWRRATLDGISSDGGVVQAKASGAWQAWGKGLDEVPEYIIHQTQHEMSCEPALRFAYVPVIIAQREFRVYRVERDEEHIGLLLEHETKFWDLLQNDIEPPASNHEDLRILYPCSRDIEIVASLEIETDAYELARTKRLIKELEKQEEALAFRLKDFMKESAVLLDKAGNTLFTWKSHQRTDLDVTRLRKERPDVAAEYARHSFVRSLLNKIK